jgi:hypothetical protein
MGEIASRTAKPRSRSTVRTQWVPLGWRSSSLQTCGNQALANWRSGWDSNALAVLAMYKLQIPRCRKCRICQDCRRALPTIAHVCEEGGYSRSCSSGSTSGISFGLVPSRGSLRDSRWKSGPSANCRKRTAFPSSIPYTCAKGDVRPRPVGLYVALYSPSIASTAGRSPRANALAGTADQRFSSAVN